MKRAALVFFVLGLLICIALGAYLLLSNSSDPSAPTNPTTNGNPFSFSSGSVSSADTIALTLDSGATVSVLNFTKEDQPEWAGDSAGYQVAGDADNSSFLITYIPADDSGSQAQFLVALLSEPVGAARSSAEAALKTRLALSNSELCSLDVQVWTNADVNSMYAGKDLGLSFCPGSTQLP
ncbi:MAG TPA: hypothetical protein PK609_01105 [Candidatus Paceibacterota bacterium]|nr:hypothetical protein [Candidatus Paceibacterota bacterium]